MWLVLALRRVSHALAPGSERARIPYRVRVRRHEPAGTIGLASEATAGIVVTRSLAP